MKKISKKISTIVFVFVLVFVSTLSTYARTDTVTKSNDLVTVKFKYTSYKDANGRNLVKDGKVISKTGKHGVLWIWEYTPESTSIKRIDGGRTYVVTVKGTFTTYHLTQPPTSYKRTTTLEFSAKK